MMRILCAVVSLSICAVVATKAHAQTEPPQPEQYSARLQARLWGPGLASQIQMSGSQTGTLVDVPEDLNVGDKGTFEIRANVQLGLGHKIRLGFTNIDYDGDTQSKKEIKFGDTTYPRFTHLVSSLKGSYFSGDYEWDFTKGQYGYVGACFGAKVFDVDGVLVAPERLDRDVETIRVPVPVLGLVTQGYAGRFSAGAELSAFTIGSTANFVELYLNTHVELTPQLGVEAGYRYFKIHGEHSNDLIDMRLSGLYFGAEVNF
jgi:hypothetical protein